MAVAYNLSVAFIHPSGSKSDDQYVAPLDVGLVHTLSDELERVFGAGGGK